MLQTKCISLLFWSSWWRICAILTCEQKKKSAFRIQHRVTLCHCSPFNCPLQWIMHTCSYQTPVNATNIPFYPWLKHRGEMSPRNDRSADRSGASQRSRLTIPTNFFPCDNRINSKSNWKYLTSDVNSEALALSGTLAETAPWCTCLVLTLRGRSVELCKQHCTLRWQRALVSGYFDVLSCHPENIWASESSPSWSGEWNDAKQRVLISIW